MVFHGEQAVLNCTMSSSPDPVYHWSIPGNCSSCLHTNNDSVMIFTADITDGWKFVCEAVNEYGGVFMSFTIVLASKYSYVLHCHAKIIPPIIFRF